MGPRDQIIQTTCSLLENQGYHGTSLNEIVRESGAPRGSIYYYFPEGKEGISAEAVRYAGQMVSERLRAHMAAAADPVKAVVSAVETIAHYAAASGFTTGGPLTIVAAESANCSPLLNEACQAAYGEVRSAFSEHLAPHLGTERAEHLAWVIVAMIEGAIILARTYHSAEPLRRTASELGALLACHL